jgi:hypothetical protein
MKTLGAIAPWDGDSPTSKNVKEQRGKWFWGNGRGQERLAISGPRPAAPYGTVLSKGNGRRGGVNLERGEGGEGRRDLSAERSGSAQGRR